MNLLNIQASKMGHSSSKLETKSGSENCSGKAKNFKKTFSLIRKEKAIKKKCNYHSTNEEFCKKSLSLDVSSNLQGLCPTGVYDFEDLKNGISSTTEEISELLNEINSIYEEHGDFIGYDDLMMLTANLSFEPFSLPTSIQESHGRRFENVDINYSLCKAMDLLKKGSDYHSNNEYMDAAKMYLLAFHYSKLIAGETSMCISERSKLCIANYQLFRAYMNLQPYIENHKAEEIERMNAILKLNNKNKNKGKKIILPKPTDKDTDENEALQRVLQAVEVTRPSVSLDAVIGQEEAKRRFLDIIYWSVERPELNDQNERTRSVMLHGPPGTGKTMLAQAVASSASHMTFFKISLSQIDSKWKGMASQTLVQLFKIAEKNKPCLIFMDEVENLLMNRTDQGEKRDDNIVQTMLEKCQSEDGIFLVCTTNKPWLIDIAFYRRFELIYVGMPNLKEREDVIKEILLFHSNEMITSKMIKKLAELTDKYSFDDIKNLLASANMIAKERVKSSNFFKETFSNSEGEKLVTACFEGDPLSFRSNPMKLPKECKILKPPLSCNDVNEALDKFKPTIPDSELKKFECFNKDMSLINYRSTLNEENNKYFFYTGFQEDIDNGIFRKGIKKN